jgi:hypothetical protein
VFGIVRQKIVVCQNSATLGCSSSLHCFASHRRAHGLLHVIVSGTAKQNCRANKLHHTATPGHAVLMVCRHPAILMIHCGANEPHHTAGLGNVVLMVCLHPSAILAVMPRSGSENAQQTILAVLHLWSCQTGCQILFNDAFDCSRCYVVVWRQAWLS